MNYETVLFSAEDGVARITLNRPDKLNSFNDRMHAELADVRKKIKKDHSVRCILITGTGRGFCAGQDLADRDFSDGNVPDLGETLEKKYNKLIRFITNIEVPVICAVNGVAAGAGANLALMCDIVFAARSASFIQAFCKLGLVPDSGGTWVLSRLVGHARAMGLALLGDKVSAEQAEQWGMIWKCVDDAELMNQTESLATHLATQPTQGLGYIKRALLASANNSLDQQLDMERDLQRLACRTSDYREGVEAFMKKRKPDFSGR